MGFFGGYLFDGTSWSEFDPAEGSGVAYFGYTPRVYFEKEPASAPADVTREAAGLAAWLARRQGRTDEATLQELIAPFIADDTPEQDDDDDDDFNDLDDADIFVEAKVARFLRLVGLPVPAGWPRA
jgi:hypothetical protein